MEPRKINATFTQEMKEDIMNFPDIEERMRQELEKALAKERQQRRIRKIRKLFNG